MSVPFVDVYRAYLEGQYVTSEDIDESFVENAKILCLTMIYPQGQKCPLSFEGVGQARTTEDLIDAYLEDPFGFIEPRDVANPVATILFAMHFEPVFLLHTKHHKTIRDGLSMLYMCNHPFAKIMYALTCGGLFKYIMNCDESGINKKMALSKKALENIKDEEYMGLISKVIRSSYHQYNNITLLIFSDTKCESPLWHHFDWLNNEFWSDLIHDATPESRPTISYFICMFSKKIK